MARMKDILITVAVLLTVIFSASPVLYAIGKWHCFWHKLAPVCQ